MQEPMVVVAARTSIAARIVHPSLSAGARMVIPLVLELGRLRGGAGPARRGGDGMSAALVPVGAGTR